MLAKKGGDIVIDVEYSKKNGLITKIMSKNFFQNPEVIFWSTVLFFVFMLLLGPYILSLCPKYRAQPSVKKEELSAKEECRQAGGIFIEGFFNTECDFPRK